MSAGRKAKRKKGDDEEYVNGRDVSVPLSTGRAFWVSESSAFHRLSSGALAADTGNPRVF